MNGRFVWSLAAFAMLFGARAALAQANLPSPSPILSVPGPINGPGSNLASLLPSFEASSFHLPAKPSPHFSKIRFVLLSTAVYGAALADMHQTLKERNYSWWRETDPLAKPFVRLPTPAYYATGLAMATGLNWLGWKMARSRRWRKLSPVPQLLTISGNLYGFRSNLH
jgi:hypothetical protein